MFDIVVMSEGVQEIDPECSLFYNKKQKMIIIYAFPTYK